MEWRLGAIASATLVVLAQYPRAAAADERCVPHTERPADAILVPLSTTKSPAPPIGISILAGETLCIAWTETADGQLQPHLADRADGDAVQLTLELQSSPHGSTLHVRTSAARWLGYRAAIVTGPANIARTRRRTTPSHDPSRASKPRDPHPASDSSG